MVNATLRRVHLRKSITDSCNNTHGLNKDYRNDEKKKKPLHPAFVSETRWRTAASIFQEGKSNSGVDKRQWESGKETVVGFSMLL